MKDSLSLSRSVCEWLYLKDLGQKGEKRRRSACPTVLYQLTFPHSPCSRTSTSDFSLRLASDLILAACEKKKKTRRCASRCVVEWVRLDLRSDPPSSSTSTLSFPSNQIPPETYQLVTQQTSAPAQLLQTALGRPLRPFINAQSVQTRPHLSSAHHLWPPSPSLPLPKTMSWLTLPREVQRLVFEAAAEESQC